MLDAEQIEIRLLTERDVAEAMRLKEAAGWNQTEEDWRRLLRLAPRGCFAATVGGRVVATTTTTAYGRALAWVGMVLVDTRFRRKGIATTLVRAALDSLEVAGVEAVKLDATPEGAHVHAGLGFEAELRIERWRGTAGRHVSESVKPSDGATPQLLEKVLELDRRAFGADRSELLKALSDEACVTPSLSVGGNGQLRGYALARRGSHATYLGPVVAEEVETVAFLLDDVLGRLGDGEVYVDLNTTFEGGARELAARGFIKQRELIRMRRGKKSPAGTSSGVFAIAGPEVG
ncbi:MAG TPA: GNAT family N-acetyltransferase [Pyrinomonadaceae bacterium]